jgi:hypothetical protein
VPTSLPPPAVLRCGMAKSLHPSQQAAETRFPYKVDIALPDSGLGRRLVEMMAWCRDRMTADEWDSHTITERAPERPPITSVRFYFSTEAAAAAFKRQWGA